MHRFPWNLTHSTTHYSSECIRITHYTVVVSLKILFHVLIMESNRRLVVKWPIYFAIYIVWKYDWPNVWKNLLWAFLVLQHLLFLLMPMCNFSVKIDFIYLLNMSFYQVKPLFNYIRLNCLKVLSRINLLDRFLM